MISPTKYPSYAFLFILALLFPVRHNHPWFGFETISALDFILLLSLVVVSIKCAFAGKIETGNHLMFLMISLPLAGSLLSLTWTTEPSTTLKTVVVHGSAVACYITTIALFRNATGQQLNTTIITSAWVLVITAAISYLPNSPISPEQVSIVTEAQRKEYLLSYHARFSHPFLGLSNSFATILALLLPFAMQSNKSGTPRWLSSLTVSLIVGAILATASRGVILSMLLLYIAILTYRIFKFQSIPKGMALPLSLSLLSGGLFFLINETASEHIWSRLSLTNVSARLDAYSIIGDILHHHPLGVGAGVPLFNISGIPFATVHNAYLQNYLWYGLIAGSTLNISMLATPFLILTPKSNLVSSPQRNALATSIALLCLINLTQASWEGSILRVWIYFITALGVLLATKTPVVSPPKNQPTQPRIT